MRDFKFLGFGEQPKYGISVNVRRFNKWEEFKRK